MFEKILLVQKVALFFLLLTIICGCGSSHTVEALKTSTIPGEIITITQAGLSSSSVAVPQNSVLYFYNDQAKEQISVSIHLTADSSINGENTTGFTSKDNIYFTENLMPPGTLATISLNTKGRYSFYVYGFAQTLEGEIVVE